MPSPIVVVAIVVGCLLAATLIWLFASRRRLTAEADLFAKFMEHGIFIAFMKDAEGRYTYANRAMYDLMRRIRPDITTVLGRTDRELFASPEGTAYVDNDRTVIAHGAPLQFDEITRDEDGTVRHWSTIKFPRLDRQGRPCVAGISIDVSDLRQARTAAQTSEDRCALALEAGQMGSMSLDLATRTLDTSPVFARLHGRPETATRLGLAESLAEVHPDDRQSLVEAVEAALHNRAPNRIAYRIVRPDGTVSWIELVGQVSTDEEGRPVMVRGVAFDVTERRAAFDELAQRRDMLRKLIEVQENERQTLCHELHDGMMQYAIGAKMLLETAHEEAESPAQAERIESALDCLERGIAEGRQVIRGVRSAVLDDLGLAPAIQDLADQLAGAGVTVQLTLDDGLDELPPALQTTVYRVVQESLANVRKHAETDRATVEVRRASGDVHVRVSDAGKGCDVAESRRRGFGILGMTERVRLAGGTCAIDCRPGGGCLVAARLPIPAADAADDQTLYAAAPGLAPR